MFKLDSFSYFVMTALAYWERLGPNKKTKVLPKHNGNGVEEETLERNEKV